METEVSDGAVNIEFQKPTNIEISNFRMMYNTIVDRYMDDSESFIPQNVETHIVDAVSNIPAQIFKSEQTGYVVSKHLATLTYA